MSYSEDFKNKRALITGGSRGIGQAIAESLLKYGADVTILDKNAESLALLLQAHPSLSTICVDLTSWDSTTSALEPLAPFDMLINCAGTCIPASFLESNSSNFDTTMATNVKSIFVVSQSVVKGMTSKLKGGTIVNISSFGSKYVSSYSAVYAASKAAVDMVTKVMAVELGPLGIRVNSVNPGCVYTDLLKENVRILEEAGVNTDSDFGDMLKRTPLLGSEGGGPIVSVSQVVETVMFLLSSRTSGGTTGQHLFVDNGYSAA